MRVAIFVGCVLIAATINEAGANLQVAMLTDGIPYLLPVFVIADIVDMFKGWK